jgi:phosphoribosyl 1,2-cyclic phosphodiesterase
MVMQLSDQLRYAAAAAILAAAWGYRKRQRTQSSGHSASGSVGIPPFRKIDSPDVRQLQAHPLKRIYDGSGSDGIKCEVAVLGSASGGGMPSLQCLLSSEHGCAACAGSAGRNTRPPQALLRRASSPETDECFVALVDCTQAAKRQMCIARNLFGEFQIDAVMVTAGRVDKFLGLNDLREVQQASRKDFRRGSGETLAIYALRSTTEMVKTALPFLFSVKQKTKTLIAGLLTQEVSEGLGERVLMPPGVSVTVRALPCQDEQLGFVFGRDEGCVAVLPDPHISMEARAWLSERAVQLLLIGNAADLVELSACAELVKAVKPRHAVITGLSCGLDHASAEDVLRAEVGELSVSVGYDGMMLETRIEDPDMAQPSAGECSCLSSGSTATGSASSGGDTITDEDRCISLSPTHGPTEDAPAAPEDRSAGRLEGKEPTAALTPVTLSVLAERHSGSP